MESEKKVENFNPRNPGKERTKLGPTNPGPRNLGNLNLVKGFLIPTFKRPKMDPMEGIKPPS